MNTEGLEEIFNIEPSQSDTSLEVIEDNDYLEVIREQRGEIAPSDVIDDYSFVRNHMNVVIKRSMEYADKVVDMGELEEDPTAFKVANDLLKTSIEAAKQFMDTHKAMQSLQSGVPDVGDGGTVIQNNTQNITHYSLTEEEMDDLMEEDDE